MIDYGLSQEIPKMETLPSMLFEETQSMVTDSQSQTRKSPLPPELLFNGTPESMNVEDVSNMSKSNESQMDSNQLICDYDQDQISHNLSLEDKPILDEEETKINIEEDAVIKMENIGGALEVLNELEIPGEIKREAIKDKTMGSGEDAVNETDANVLNQECNVAEHDDLNEEVNVVAEMDLHDKSESLSQ